MARKKKNTNNDFTEKELKSLLRKRQYELLRQPGVTSVGIGFRDNDPKKEMCIQVTVKKKKSRDALALEEIDPLPDSLEDIDGKKVPIQVLERDFKVNYNILDQERKLESIEDDMRKKRRSHVNPIMPGISVSHTDGTAGTLGAIVFDKNTGRPLILSNWHVLHGDNREIGDTVVQPGPHDDNNVDDNFLGLLIRSHLGIAGDCAVASIENRDNNTEILELDVSPKRIAEVSLGDTVVKSGRTTGVTYGIVRRVAVVAEIYYGPATEYKEIGGFEIGLDPEFHSSHDEISMGGDSGSLWMINTDGEDKDVVVGLHFAGEGGTNPDEHAIACNIHSVLNILDITFNPIWTNDYELNEMFKLLGYESELEETSYSDREDIHDKEDLEDNEDTPVTLEQIEKIEELLEIEPDETLKKLQDAWNDELTLEQARSAISLARGVLKNPSQIIPVLHAESALESISDLPPDFNFPGIDLGNIPIEPNSRKFEHSDWLGWAIFDAKSIFRSKKAKFRWADQYPSEFTYELKSNNNSPIEIALFSDFGTGLYHSKYIAKHITEGNYPYAMHLGDVYYAGRKSEFKKHFRDPLKNMLENNTELFMLNSNHEMHSGGKYYFKFLDWKKEKFGQLQEGSHFILENKNYMIVGIDTDYHKDHRYPKRELQNWLRENLSRGKQENKINILLSADHPYKFNKDEFTELYDKDLTGITDAGLVDLWFWGNTHYCGLFERTKRTPFIGCCIGHGGFPYAKRDMPSSHRQPAPIKFLETKSRFWGTDIRKDRGNNGYCIMKLNQDQTVDLNFIDWRHNEVYKTSLSRIDSNGPLARFS